jgi:hypothetical protein
VGAAVAGELVEWHVVKVDGVVVCAGEVAGEEDDGKGALVAAAKDGPVVDTDVLAGVGEKG